jgi:hypothetical protein
MPQVQSNFEVHQDTHAGYLGGNEQGELPVDDPPPAEHPAERYSAWKATSIFEFQPFSAPPSR